jgi:alkaline phosphatase D
LIGMRMRRFDRREFLQSAASLTGAALLGGPRAAIAQAPAIVTSDRLRPSAAFGAAAGDVDGDRAIIWSRTDRPARLEVEYATTSSFTNARRILGPAAIESSDFTAQVDLAGLPAGQRIFYRVRFQNLHDTKIWSEPIEGTFTTAPTSEAPRDVTIAFTADVCGQGWGINRDMGGMRLFETMRAAGADVFIHLGDTIYADQPLQAEVTLDDGTIWKNLVTEEKSAPAQSLAGYRGAQRYNLLDDNVRRFNASLSQFVIWDDHEVRDNWYPSQIIPDRDPRYTERSVALLSAWARRSFLEYHPVRLNPVDPERIYRSQRFGPDVEIVGFDMRSYRGANSPNRQTVLTDDARILGAAQVAWLKQRLKASTATWKIIASDMPLGLIVTDGPTDFEAVANGDNGAPLGRELEIADLLKFIRDERIRNVVFITADVHYCAAHYYDPAKAVFTEFSPFWEFVAGPAHAGTFGPNTLDRTFGPEARFIGIPAGMKPNRPPSAGFQFFGTLKADARTKTLTVRLIDLAGKTLFQVDLPAERG